MWQVLAEPRGVMWNDEEVLLKNFMGKTLQLSFHFDNARNLPRRNCAGVFASFKSVLTTYSFRYTVR